MENFVLTNLLCEYCANPIGIESPNPRLFWQIQSPYRNIFQQAYWIQVSTSKQSFQSSLNWIWNTNWVESDANLHIEYTGPALLARTRYYWRVKIRDTNGNESEWSEDAFWEMGLLEHQEWNVPPKTNWITYEDEKNPKQSFPCPYFRKSFTIAQPIQNARVYVTALGLYRLTINGQAITEDLLRPGNTNYHKRIQYQVYDITAFLRPGENVIGVILGDGWYRGSSGMNLRRNAFGDQIALLIRVIITMIDGKELRIGSDASWKASYGPLLQSDLFLGEVYDAQLELPGWDTPEFDDSTWNFVQILPYEEKKQLLVAQYGPSVRKMDLILPQKIFLTPKKETVLDMGQNFAGYVIMEFDGTGHAGAVITLRHSETLDTQGNFSMQNLAITPLDHPERRQIIKYIAKGHPREYYEPFFTFHGFRYIKIESPEISLSPENFKGWAIYTQMPITSHFECSHSLLNRFHQNVTWSQRSNFVDIPTDCPQREKMGWTGDIQIYAPTAGLNMQIGGFITKWLMDLASEQQQDGSLPPVIPEASYKSMLSFMKVGTAGWADACILVPWTLYLLNGDTKILRQLYPVMQKWHAYVEQHTQNYIWKKGYQWGDWLEVGRGFVKSVFFTRKDWIATAYFAQITYILSQIAEILGYSEDMARLGDLHKKIVHAYQKRFIDGNGMHHPHKQGAYIIGLQFGLFPVHLHTHAFQHLLQLLHEHNYHLATGFLSTPYFLDVLTQNNALEDAYRLLLQETYPSWLYEVKMGATTIWETWNAIKPDNTVIKMSQNHYAFGAVDRWLFTTIAGISMISPGFRRVRINPQPRGGISWCKSQIISLYGVIRSEWMLNDSQGLDLHVIIPPNSIAEIVIPKKTPFDPNQWQKLFRSHAEIIKIDQREKESLLIVGSGEYHFFFPR